MTIDTAKKTSFYIANAFSTNRFGGNPATVVFLQDELPDAELAGIAQNFNQPVTTFIYPPTTPNDESSDTASFRIRWFITTAELPLCGHGTLAAAGIIFSVPGLVPPNVKALRLEGKHNTLFARQADDKVEITLSSGDLEKVSAEETERVAEVIGRAIGDVKVNSVLKGASEAWKKFVVIEVEENGKDDLANRQVDSNIFVRLSYFLLLPVRTSWFAEYGAHPLSQLETNYPSNIVTARSNDPKVAFVSRVFHGAFEDPVCGAAHGLMVPYWSEKLGFGDDQVAAKQVSQRAGDLRVKWDKGANTIALAGHTVITMSGHMLL
ncbi:hypothetical protein EIP91_002583 [Steccherinum ochraceum]|uniref:Phenazine biosynthesis protein n=1 Tax=Steccherinum ochraceum TaxID=92696 RepID=A0A4R0REC6_9APHY|nr:hypothetical protein EIP91_002583 [Steccherinum ochraceum]